MTVLYWGDSVNTPNGNWNTASNWWTTLGDYCRCCGSTNGTPAGRIPTVGDTVVLVGGSSLTGNITTGPSTPFAGAISWYNAGLGGSQVVIAAGNYTGSVTIGKATTNSTSSDAGGYTQGISGGSFSGAVALEYNALTSSIPIVPTISGGTFTGTVSRLPPRVSTTAVGLNQIIGGTYSPIATCAVSGGQLVTTNLPNDPGFAAGGGTYSPTINVTGIPDILGAGLL